MSRNLAILAAYIVFFCIVYLLAAEFISSSKSKGEILLFRRGLTSRPEMKPKDDEESADSGAFDMTGGGGDLAAGTDEESNVATHKRTSIFHWKDVCYDISIKGERRRILDNVNGWVKPGTLTALIVLFRAFM